MTTIEIFPLRYTPADLASVPQDEALFFLMCGQLHNDIAVLQRQTLQARALPGDAEPLRTAAATAASLNTRLLVGRVSEGWSFVQHRFQKAFRDYGGAIPADAKTDLAELNQYFGGTCLIRILRNRVAAHFDQDAAREAYGSLDPAEPLVDFHSRLEGNTIYFSGEALMLTAMHQIAGEADAAASLDRIFGEVLAVSQRLSNVIWAFLKAFSEVHLGPHLGKMKDEMVVLRNQPTLEDFVAPVFLAHPGLPRGQRPKRSLPLPDKR